MYVVPLPVTVAPIAIPKDILFNVTLVDAFCPPLLIINLADSCGPI